MLVHPNFDPIALQIGPIAIRWYGLMYLIGFAAFFFLARRRSRTQPWSGATYQLVDDMLFYGVLGVILGGRLGYVLFYKPLHFLGNPLDIIKVWEGGMSFHGGFLGVLVAALLVARNHKIHWLALTDFIVPMVPIGLATGRIGNFINAELYGRVTDVAWGMVFRVAGAGNLPRHPSQLYQFALEGVTLFIVLWMFSMKQRPTGAVSGLFLISYGVCRFVVEFYREPDDYLGLLSLGFTMGQWLSLPMLIAGIWMMVWSYRRQPT
ncbi:MAG: prolipoprotein diacylglyceryl transferase [Betaproteobacteria bacterium]|nr:prolipoprotein diacylglyceryl transferase [Betaproteobacteria bacterium]